VFLSVTSVTLFILDLLLTVIYAILLKNNKVLVMVNTNKVKKVKEVQRASYRFDKDIFENFRAICKQEGYSQVRLLEKLMQDFIIKINKERENERK
jgi:hypothetical protein